MLRRCRRRHVLPLLSQCSPVRRRSSFAKPRPPPRQHAHGDIRSSSDDPLALVRRRGTTAGRAVFELPFQCSLLRLHGTAAVPHATPRKPSHDGMCSTSENPAAPEQQRGAAGTRPVLEETPNRDAVSYAAKVALHLQRRNLPRAEALFRAAPAAARGLYLDTIMLDGYVKDGRVDRARQLFDGMPLKNMVSWTCTVSGYRRAGRVEEARRLFDVMPHRDVISWTALMQGYASNGMLREAREMFDRMQCLRGMWSLGM